MILPKKKFKRESFAAVFLLSAILILCIAISMKEQSEFGTALKNNDINKLSMILQKHPEFANPGVNSDSSDRTTPLHDAVLYGHIETAELLIRHGADIEAENHNFKTALDLAEELKNKKMVEFLKQKGAKEKGRADQ